MARKTKWQELLVTDRDGDPVGALGDVVSNCPANLDSATLAEGRITEWPDYFIAAPGAVDWTGFEPALNRVRGAA